MKGRYKAEIEGKKITVMRIGLLGRGVGDTAFLAENGADVLVVDSASKEVMQPSVDALTEYKNVRFKFGAYDLKDFTECDMVLKGAGTPLNSPEIKEAQAKGVPIEMSASLFQKLAKIPIVGVTGTRGKSTVTHMIYHVLREGVEGEGILLGGNVRGVSNLQLLHEVREESIAVMELDSWQLQGFGYSKISPQISVFTSFMSDHMNYYNNDIQAYFEDKAQIFLHQGPGDLLVTTPAVFRLIEAYAHERGLTLRGEVSLADDSSLPEGIVLRMPGAHNLVNAGLATEVLRAMGLEEEAIRAGLNSFRGVPGRLELMGIEKGVTIYNDNNATTPEATVAGIRAVAEGKNIVLIMGGADKTLDPAPLLAEIKKHVKATVLIDGTGSDNVRSSISNVHDAHSLEEAIDIAMQNAENGDVILFSPAFASFGMFKNEYDRNDQFVALIQKRLDKEI